jgi:hypothetical protein
LEVEMLTWPMSVLMQAVVPPVVESADPLSFIERLQVVGVIALMFWLAVRFNAWIEVRIASKRLLREIRRELGHHTPRHGGSEWRG